MTIEGGLSMTFQNLLEELKENIQSGRWERGRKIPTLVELSSIYNVSVSTIREVLKVLENNGYISIQQGRGTFVLGQLPDDETKISPSSLIDLLKLSEYRRMIEPQFAEMAAKQAFQEEIELICHSANHMQELSKKNLSTVEEDMRFHLLIAKATHNDFCIENYMNIQSQLKQGRSYTNIPRMKEKAAHYHSMIANAIRNRNAEEAKTYMASHMETNLEHAIYELTGFSQEHLNNNYQL